MNYEAAEILTVGRAQDVILGIKELPVEDNRIDPDMCYQDTWLGVFDE
jgi:hypothetical protein